MIHVLLAEDEVALAKIIKDSLESRADFHITLAANGNEVLTYTQKVKPDIYVLDVMMPQLDGFTLAKIIRQNDKQTPILFLTARSELNDLLTGFKLGGNDYLKKPFEMEELIVRIQALLRHPIEISTQPPTVPTNYQLGAYTFHVPHQTLQIGEHTESLSHRESELLRMLCECQNQVLDRRIALRELWGDDNFFTARSMDVFITKLRKKLRKDSSIQIINIRGIGYKLLC